MDLYTEEEVALRRSAARQALAEALAKAKNIPVHDLRAYKQLCNSSYGVLRPVLWMGMVFMSAVYNELFDEPCADGCAKAAKKALGYKFCPHCGSKL